MSEGVCVCVCVCVHARIWWVFVFVYGGEGMHGRGGEKANKSLLGRDMREGE